MAKKTAKPETAPVQCRLTVDEIAEIDQAGQQQSVPVDRATMVAFILRNWLKDQREKREKSRRL